MPARTKLSTRRLIRHFRERFRYEPRIDRRAVAAFMRIDRKYYTREWMTAPGRYANLQLGTSR